VYDNLFLPLPRIEKHITIISNLCEEKENSIFLDIGSGTGMFVHALNEKGFQAIGVDQSKDMIAYSQKLYPSLTFIEGDVMIPMQFESNTFSHICCVDWTIYLMKDKNTLFQNIYNWLTIGGYFCLQVIDPDNFDTSRKPTKPLGNIETLVEFDDFYYKSNRPKEGSWIETFTDKKTNHVRQNERNWYMESMKSMDILAKNHGFIKMDNYSDDSFFIYKKKGQ
jgi:SAM-dependent methyltransferase